MRKIGLLLIAVMMILPAMAQVSFGVRAGGAYSSLIQKVEDTYEAGARFGFSIAGLADIPLSKNKKWSLRPEVALIIRIRICMGWRFIINVGITLCRFP